MTTNAEKEILTLVELLQERAKTFPDRTAYVFLEDGEDQEIRISYSELDRRARAIAATLQGLNANGERALLLYAPGIEYIASYFGCLYAGVIAVPAYPPDPSRINKTLPRLMAIVKDAGAKIVLTTEGVHAFLPILGQQAPELAEMTWIATDTVDPEKSAEWKSPVIDPETLAFLQYTSGSTGNPKGVMVSHGNLIHNINSIQAKVGRRDDSCWVSWLPIYHDMGLIGGILTPMYGNYPCVFMSPISFLQKPVRWLKAISKHGGTVTTAPNFAYELCIRKTTDDEKKNLDFSRWELALNGAEPIRADTLDRFSEAFKECGFRKEAIFPCYGLAEGTLMASGVVRQTPPLYVEVSKESLKKGQVVAGSSSASKTFVGCGTTILNQKLIIVDPESQKPVAEGDIGEIWLSGPSVAKGYWQNAEATQETFGARIAGTEEGPFLRTGDLGFERDGQLFIAGRCKDLIIFSGRNVYPQDIELTVEGSSPALRTGCGAAFSVDVNGEERLVVVHELERRFHDAGKSSDFESKRRPDPNVEAFTPSLDAPPEVDIILTGIKSAIAEEHEVPVHSIVLIKAGSLPKTSSGKVQRRLCKKNFLAGELEVLFKWAAPVLTVENKPRIPMPVSDLDTEESFEIVKKWIYGQLAQMLGVPPDQVEMDQPFSNYGMSSVKAVEFSGDVEARFKIKVPNTLLWDYPTPGELVKYIASHREAVIRQEKPSAEEKKEESDPVAIIGMACRFPGADNLESFWNLLLDEKDAISEVPPDRWNLSNLYDPDPNCPGKMNTKWGGFLKDVRSFDAEYFRIGALEAERIDPQQRLLLEVANEAFEDAGLIPASLAGSKTGVFVGISSIEYLRRQATDLTRIDPYMATGNAHSIAANRISYTYNLQGPSLAVDTACSSSLVAINQACRSIQAGESELAVAGGVNVILSPELTINFSKAGLMSPDGRCKSFGKDGNGFVRGEGAGLIVLKSLRKAKADGDRIYAVIRGGAVNNDGRTNGIMAPNALSQERVLNDALKSAGVSPEMIQYVEAHGTGTALGDPIEARALGKVFSQGRGEENLCRLGSVKSNIGHLESAAGAAGIIKLALSIYYSRIPRSLHSDEPNPTIPFGELKLRLQSKAEAWPVSADGVRLGGISSFGFGGTNCHLILEGGSVCALPKQGGSNGPQLVSLSAKTEAALGSAIRDFQLMLESSEDASLVDISYTSLRRREQYPFRMSAVANGVSELADKLGQYLRGEEDSDVFVGGRVGSERKKLMFVYSGSGSQWVGMGSKLFEAHSVFRNKVLECDVFFKPLSGWSLAEALKSEVSEGRLEQTEFYHPLLFAIQTGISAQLRSLGINSDGVMGHSVGEVAAGYESGMLTLEDAVKLIYHRSRLIQGVQGKGKVLSVQLPMTEAEDLVTGRPGLSVAGSNSPGTSIVAGTPQAIEGLQQVLGDRGVYCKMVRMNFAAHSEQMDSLLPNLEKEMMGLRGVAGNKSLYSTVYAKEIKGEDIDATYWGKNLRQPVRFSETVAAAARAGYGVFMEISPHPVLTMAMTETLEGNGQKGKVLGSLRRKRDEVSDLLYAAGSLHALGQRVDLKKLAPEGRVVSLTHYPYQRKTFWLETPELNGLRLPFPKGWTAQHKAVVTFEGPDGSVLRQEVVSGFGKFSGKMEGSDWIYGLEWKDKKISTLQKGEAKGPWVVFKDAYGVGDALIRRMVETGEKYWEVVPGESFSKLGENRFCLDPRSAEQFSKLLECIGGISERVPLGIVHLWSLDIADNACLNETGLENAKVLGSLSVVNFLRGMASQNIKANGLFLVTRHGQSIAGYPGQSSLGQSMLWGIQKSVSVEFPEMNCKIIDLDGNVSPSQSAETLWSEVLTLDAEDSIAYRGSSRKVLRLVRRDILRGAESVSLEADRTYFITGGLGGLGIEVAQWLATHGAKYIALNARRAASEKAQKAIKSMVDAGVRVEVFLGDVSCFEELENVLTQVRSSMPPLGGVIHAAGTLEDGLLRDLDDQKMTRSLAAKVLGSWNLHRLTLQDDLAFFTMFSSMSSVLPTFRQGAYSAANMFLDELAHFRSSQGKPALAINWGAWDSEGMAQKHRTSHGDTLKGFIPLTAGLDLLGAMLGLNVHQVAVNAMGVQDIVHQLYFGRVPALLSDLVSNEGLVLGQDNARQKTLVPLLQQASEEKRYDLLVDFLKVETCKLLGTVAKDDLDIARGFFELGMDSLSAMSLKARIEFETDRRYPPTLAFDFPNILQLAKYLYSEIFGKAPNLENKKDDAEFKSNLVETIAQLSDEQIQSQFDEILKNHIGNSGERQQL